AGSAAASTLIAASDFSYHSSACSSLPPACATPPSLSYDTETSRRHPALLGALTINASRTASARSYHLRASSSLPAVFATSPSLSCAMARLLCQFLRQSVSAGSTSASASNTASACSNHL